ncbi:hypothetical protein [Deinococcus irradiatisoli]|nr:hypothetical protein [Deinococcus irradiatisoli]
MTKERKTEKVKFPQGMGDYEYPNPAGGGVFCLQRRVIGAMCRKTPGEIFRLVDAALSTPLIRRVLEKRPRMTWPELTEKSGEGEEMLAALVGNWAGSFHWEAAPKWFLTFAVDSLSQMATDEHADESLAAWRNTSQADLARVKRENVSPASYLPLLGYWSPTCHPDTVSFELEVPLPSVLEVDGPWDPVAELSQDYRRKVRNRLGKDFARHKPELDAYLEAACAEVEAVRLDPELYRQTHMNKLHQSSGHRLVGEPDRWDYQVSNHLALYVFGGLSYSGIAAEDIEERLRNEASRKAQGDMVRRQKKTSARTIEKEVEALAEQIKIQLRRGRHKGYRQTHRAR